MTLEQGLVFSVILLTLAMLVLEIWRYDVVALIGMVLLVALGLISVEEAFAGFGHHAVVTIAAVLVVSRGLQNTGVADFVARWMSGVGDNLALQLVVLCGLVVVSSAFMNNIAALAIFIPVAVRISMKSGRPTSLYLLPMAFSSHFGGLITLIGTPTNLIVSAMRVEHVGNHFGMFEFAPIGIGISVIGIAFTAFLGWRLIPRRKGKSTEQNCFEQVDYLTEIEVPANSKLAGVRLHDLDSVTDAEIWVAVIYHDGHRISSPSGSDEVHAGDVLLLQAEAPQLRQFIFDTGVELTESKPIEADEEKEEAEEDRSQPNFWKGLKSQLQSNDIETVEAIVRPDSILAHRTARAVDLRARYGVNLLAISRPNENLRHSIGSTELESGDVLLLEAHHEDVSETLQDLGCLPLAEREIHLEPRNLILGLVIFFAALLSASLNLLSVPTSMTAAAVAMVVTGILTPHEAYQNVQWPIVVLLGAMLSLGGALEQTGGDQLIADQILRVSHLVSPAALLVVIMLATMMLSDIVNNAAAVVLMTSISINVARGLGASIDPFLVAVAVGGACAFLTPVGHEANVLVFDVGGYEFGDYWRLGLPLELLITAVTVPLLLWIWPL